jgi:hypothetical protein
MKNIINKEQTINNLESNENIEIITDFEEIVKLFTSEIKINLVEVASGLADLATRRDIVGNDDIEYSSDEWNKIYIEDDEGIKYREEEVQEIFNKHYDYYYDIIDSLKLN